MSEPMPDEDLEALFARQRAADRERAPAFHAMRTRALASEASRATGAMSSGWRWLLPAGAALVLAIALAVVAHHPAPVPTRSPATLAQQLDEIDAALRKSLAAQDALTAWQSPTDFLLNPIHN